MALPGRRTESVASLIWQGYIAVGTITAIPAFFSYMIAWPFAFHHVSQQGASFLQALAIVFLYDLAGSFSSLLRIAIWPYSVYLLFTGGYPSLWAFLFPAFYLMPNVGH